MKKLITGLLAVGALLVFASSALAGGTIKSLVSFDVAGAIPTDNSKEFVAGQVSSVADQCQKNRTVKITGIYGVDGGATSRPFDTAKTGKNGGFSGIGPSASGGQDLEGAKLKLLPKTIGPNRHPKTCSGDAITAD